MTDKDRAGTEQGDTPPRTPRRTGRRLHGAIAQRLGTAIVSGEFAPGDVLHGEVAFAEALDVSRSAFREAVQLIAKGLVENRPKMGTRVLPRSRWNLHDPDLLAWAFAGGSDIKFVRGLFERRGIVKPAAAALAGSRRSRADLTTMKDALATMRQHGVRDEAGRVADRAVHEAILRATGSEALFALSASIGAAVIWRTQFKQRARALPRSPVPDHARAYSAGGYPAVDG